MIAALSAVCLSMAGCLNKTGNKQKTINGEGLSSPDKLPTETELVDYLIPDRKFERKGFYVIDPHGVVGRHEPDEGSDSLIYYSHGQYLNVIVDPGQMYEALYYNPALYCHPSSGVSPDFYAVADDIYRERRDDERDCTLKNWKYEMVFVKRKALGDISEVRLIPGEVNDVIEYDDKFGKNERTFSKWLTVELIDRCVYDSMKVRKAVNFQAESAPKIDKVITSLKTESGREVVFKDCTDVDVDDYRYYHYKGVYEALNKYLVSIEYGDYLAHCFVDKITGETTEVYGFPYVSPDMKWILCLNPVEITGVTLYKITDDRKIEFIMDANYLKWGVVDHRDGAFWGADGAFYCIVRHRAVNYCDNPNLQYLRIKLLSV